MQRRSMALVVLALGIASVMSLAFAARLVPLAEVVSAMRSVRVVPALGVLAAFVANHLLRMVRFRALLGPGIPPGRVVSACLVGFFAICVLPLRLGEVVRPAALARDGVPLEVSLAALLVERALDLLVLLGLLAWVGLVVQLPGGPVVSGVDVLTVGRQGVGTLAVVLAVGLVVVAAVGPQLPARPPWLTRPLGRFAGALRALVRDPARAAVSLVLTALTWATAVLYVGVGLTAVPGLPADPRAATVTWTTILASTTVLPTPGFIGSFEAGAVEALGWLGGAAGPALAFAVLLHAAYLVFVAVLGITALLWDWRGWRALS